MFTRRRGGFGGLGEAAFSMLTNFVAQSSGGVEGGLTLCGEKRAFVAPRGGERAAPRAAVTISRRARRVAVSLSMMTAACTPVTAPSARAPAAAWTEPPGLHQTRFVTVAAGVRLEVVDWGGSGPPVLLLPGLSGTAHQYDDFAPGLVDRFHVYGLTRRGWGLSSVPETGYDVATLVKDMGKVLDALKIDRVDVIGHSAGGEELTAFAIAFPERVDRLVYLDAAYDRTDPALQAGDGECVNVEPPAEADLATAETFGAWFARSRGVQLPTAEVHMLFDHHGPSEAASLEYMKSLVRPDYARVKAPALALYAAAESAADFYPAWSRLDAAARAKARACFENGKEQAVGRASRADFRAHAAHGKVIELAHAGHYLFISQRDVVLGYVKAFLLAARSPWRSPIATSRSGAGRAAANEAAGAAAEGAGTLAPPLPLPLSATVGATEAGSLGPHPLQPASPARSSRPSGNETRRITRQSILRRTEWCLSSRRIFAAPPCGRGIAPAAAGPSERPNHRRSGGGRTWRTAPAGEAPGNVRGFYDAWGRGASFLLAAAAVAGGSGAAFSMLTNFVAQSRGGAEGVRRSAARSARL